MPEGVKQAVGAALAAGIGAAVGGSAGAATAFNEDVNNRQLHSQERQKIRELAKKKAEETCAAFSGLADCVKTQTLYWTDALERVAESLVDDREYASNMTYLTALIGAQQTPGSIGAVTGEVDDYLRDLGIAREMLTPYMGQIIAGTDQTYFSATPEQRANYGLNDFLGSSATSIIPGMENRDKDRLEHAATHNESIQPVVVEDVLLGITAIARRVALALGRSVAGEGIGTGVKAGTTTLYRAVGPAELADIQATGVLRNLGSAEGKYFTTSAAEAAAYAKQAVKGFSDPPYTIIKVEVPSSIFKGLVPASVDRGIPAWVIPNNRLPGLAPVIEPAMPIPPAGF
jgi:filamentous hemagglutinin